ncbi:MAG TPA: GAF domain-containing protein, partial [Planctomycetota bacterium]|nr:GAF domain-containing protein [Planctomycetota bacterium]
MAVKRDWLSAIYEISKIINATLELGEILDVVARETRRLLEFDRLVLGLLEEGGDRLRLLVPVAHPGTRRPTGALIPLEGHVLGQATRTQQVLVIPDLRADSRFPGDRPLVEEGVISCIALPLVSASRVLGALAFARREPRPFSDAEAELLRNVAEQVATALDHAKLFAAEKKRANHLAIITHVARRALSIFDLDTLLQETASLIQEQFAYYDVSVFLVDRATDEVVLRAQAGAYRAASAVGYRQPIGVGVVGRAAEVRQTVLANDVASDPHYVVAFEGERASKAELAVPIKLGGEAVGVINVESTEVGAFDHIDVTALETLSDQVAQAIENVRLMDETLREKQKLDDIVSAMGAGVVLIDRDLTIVWSNKTINAWFGGGRSVVGQKCHVVHANPVIPCPHCMARATFDTGEAHTDIQVHHSPALGLRHFENIFAPIRDHKGKVAQIIMLAFDVTEHARNVEQLALLRKLSEVMQGVVELDRLLHLVLTCVTAGAGLGFNRALLLLVSDDGTTLEGRLGVGPASAEEAAHIWRELAQRAATLEDVLALFDEPHAPTDTAMRYLARQIRIPLSEAAQVPVRALT